MPFYEINFQGIVQGVGFRPFIKKLADSLSLRGNVYNTTRGVTVNLETSLEKANEFIALVYSNAPALAHILSSDIKESSHIKHFKGFEIEKSVGKTGVTLVSPDVAICKDCLDEIADEKERRYEYPFTNCTNCGPRYSIMLDLPYDRPNTIMKDFKMCEACLKEYENSSDRRFHAQPIACKACGPEVFLHHADVKLCGTQAIKYLADKINDGQIVAMKGLGGYHIICDAQNDSAVKKLRHLKKRATKPFAIMVLNSDILSKYTKLEKRHEEMLNSSESPIVIFGWKNHPLSPSINPSSDKIGVMRAYTPLHAILFKYLKTEFIVATSANFKDEPISKDLDEAENKLSFYTNIFLHHNRDIQNRVDDSVLTLTQNSYTLLRRARGFAPFPVMIKSSKDEEVFAAGANLKSSIAFYKGGFAFLSQYIGDLDNVETENFYKEVYESLKKLFNIKETAALRDIHPSYRSSIFADGLGLETHEFQHHAAHFAACLAENACYEDAIGIVLDGFGIGNDETAWGGEFFVKKDKNMERVAHLKPFHQPGLDSAAKNPVRMLISYLYSNSLLEKALPLLKSKLQVSDEEIKLIKFSIDSGINSILTSSAGRLFEAIGSLLLEKRSNEYEGELAINLESVASDGEKEFYDFEYIDGQIDIKKALSQILEDKLAGADVGKISAKFHNGFAKIISEVALEIADVNNIKTVALSGGVFQNIRLLDYVSEQLVENGMKVLTHKKVPANDAGIALGQLYLYLCEISLK